MNIRFLKLLLVAGVLACTMSFFGAAAQEILPTETWMPVAPGIGETPDYQYQDASRSLQIKRYEENGIVYFVADVQLAGAECFQTARSDGKTEFLSKMAKREGAILAINGDDYGTHKKGIIIRNGELLRAKKTGRNLLIVDAEGNMSVRADRDGEDPEALGKQLIDGGTLQTFEFGPELIRDGQAVEFSKAFDLISLKPSRREPRTAIGQIGSLHYLIVVADGRQKGYSKGMTLPELQKIFLDFGAQTAMNLDGGGSTELWFNGEIVNIPCQGRERHLTDCIFF